MPPSFSKKKFVGTKNNNSGIYLFSQFDTKDKVSLTGGESKQKGK